MPEIKQDLEIWAGEDVDIRLHGIQGIGELNTINKIMWRITETADSTDPLNGIEKTIEKSGGSWIMNDIYIEEETNLLIIQINRNDTLDMGGSRYYHELIVIDGANNTNVATVGRIKVNNSNFVDVGV